MAFQVLETDSLPMKKGRLIKSLADSTIRGVVEAIVELVTNSNDSFIKEELGGNSLSGKINIFVFRTKGGHCTAIKVVDEAGGMDHQSLKKSIEFGSETSGFKEGRSVRGFFGRGLKEAIIALGRGSIFSIRNSVLSKVDIYYDDKTKDAKYELAVPMANLTFDDIKQYGFTASTGTVVHIDITNNKKDFLPGRNSIIEQLTDHYALRDINSSVNRSVILNYIEPESKDGFSLTSPLKYVYPEGKTVYEEDINLEGDNIHFRIMESTKQLESPKSPNGNAGLLIKTEGTILDNQLFGFEVDPIGLYFFGEIVCPGIAKSIRSGDETIVDFNRGGLDWRHSYNKKLEESGRQILRDLIKKKKELLNIEKHTKVSEPIEKMLDKVCRKLSTLAESELEEREPGPGEVESFMIRPLIANVGIAVPRNFSVYVPKYMAEEEGTKVVKLNTSNPRIKLINSEISLDYSKKDNQALKSTFKVIGENEGDVATIMARLGGLTTTAEARVKEPGKIGKRHNEPGGGGGMFRKIIPSPDEDPIQRALYSEGGIIKIFVKFPGIKNYLGESFELVDTVEGRIILAEILIEAFCRSVASLKRGKEISEEIDPFNSELDRLRRISTPVVYDTILKANLDSMIAN